MQRLSDKTIQQIRWDEILDQAAELTDVSRGKQVQERQVAPTPDLEVFQRQVPLIFAKAQAEFSRVSQGLQFQMRLVMALQILLALVIAGSAVYAVVKSALFATIVTGGGLAGLFGMFVQSWKLSREQMMLAFLPAKYELALQLCTTKEDFQKVLKEFLEETTSRAPGESKPVSTKKPLPKVSKDPKAP